MIRKATIHPLASRPAPLPTAAPARSAGARIVSLWAFAIAQPRALGPRSSVRTPSLKAAQRPPAQHGRWADNVQHLPGHGKEEHGIEHGRGPEVWQCPGTQDVVIPPPARPDLPTVRIPWGPRWAQRQALGGPAQ